MDDNILVIGIAGGTGSGKTTLMNNLISRFEGMVTVISHDNYYKRHDDMTYEERSQLNYDEPAAFDTSLMVYHLEELRRGHAIECPVYDFTIHNRSEQTIHIVPKKVIIVEGILIFENEELRNLMDIRIFVDTDADIRLCRRIKRDVKQAGKNFGKRTEAVSGHGQAHARAVRGAEQEVRQHRRPRGRKKSGGAGHDRRPHPAASGGNMNYESLIFDIDGTLWDSRALVAEGYNIQLNKEGLSRYCITAETLKPLFGRVMTEIADVLFADFPEKERYALMARCMETENRHLHENPCHIGYPGVRETMEELAKTHRLFIVSNSQQGYPELCISKLGLTGCITGHLCFGDTGTSKGKTIRTLMEKYHITSCAYIGDTQGDYEATVEAGVPFLWASYGFGTPAGYAGKIDSFEDLLKL